MVNKHTFILLTKYVQKYTFKSYSNGVWENLKIWNLHNFLIIWCRINFCNNVWQWNVCKKWWKSRVPRTVMNLSNQSWIFFAELMVSMSSELTWKTAIFGNFSLVTLYRPILSLIGFPDQCFITSLWALFFYQCTFICKSIIFR